MFTKRVQSISMSSHHKCLKELLLICCDKLAGNCDKWFRTERKLKTFWSQRKLFSILSEVFLSRSRVNSRACAQLLQFRTVKTSPLPSNTFPSLSMHFSCQFVSTKAPVIYVVGSPWKCWQVFHFCSSNISATSVWRNELEEQK